MGSAAEVETSVEVPNPGAHVTEIGQNDLKRSNVCVFDLVKCLSSNTLLSLSREWAVCLGEWRVPDHSLNVPEQGGGNRIEMGEMGETQLQIGSKVMVSGLQGAEYAPLDGRIGWITGHDKQRRLCKVG